MPKLQALLAAFVVAAGAVAAPASRESVDLNDAHSLEALRRTNPEHYEKIQDILAGLDMHNEPEVPQWIATRYGARDVSYQRPLLRGDTDTRALSFDLDGVHYEARLSVPQRVAHLQAAAVY